jgi:hypothetical protein
VLIFFPSSSDTQRGAFKSAKEDINTDEIFLACAERILAARKQKK